MGDEWPFLPVVQVGTHILVATVNGIIGIGKVKGKNVTLIQKAD
jgi:hypothetical protein